jgi:hypothetical protein
MSLRAAPVSSSDDPAKELNDAQKAEATEWLTDLKKYGDHEAWTWMQSQVPPALQKEFLAQYPEPTNPDAPKTASP